MGSEAEEKVSRRCTGRRRRVISVYQILATLGILALVLRLFDNSRRDVASSGTAAVATNVRSSVSTMATTQKSMTAQKHSGTDVIAKSALSGGTKTISDFESCNVSIDYSNSKEWNTKPLWFSSYPDSIPDNTHKSIINNLTGLKAGGKSFYASMKGLRHCFGTTETATCQNIHPIVGMNKGGPDDLSQKYYDRFIFAIRNPATAIPAFTNSKAIKYHGVKGQVPISDWRKHRDEYMTGMMDAWKLTLKTWKDMQNYKVGAYLPYEHLMDPNKGPQALSRIANVLKTAGFVTPSEDDIPCIWYQSVGREQLEQYRQFQYEYSDYFPGYTEDQKEYLMKELWSVIDEYADDEELISILKEYRDETQEMIVDTEKGIVEES